MKILEKSSWFEVYETMTIGNDNIGFLSFFESERDINFVISRVYYVKAPKDTVRGKHAHKLLQQVLWCPSGSITLLLDNGMERKEISLDKPNKLVFVNQGIWREMVWNSDNALLCVVASDNYDESDYIRDYNEFISYVSKGYWKNEN